MTEENFAQAIREVAVMLRDAEYAVAKTEADVKRIVAKAMFEGEMKGNKSAAAQVRYADEREIRHLLRPN
jgi:hypothetical protein